jgi:hypothetical protein
MITLNPLQTQRIREIEAGKKFWGYLDTEAMRSRYVLAAHFLRSAKHIVEVGGYRGNAITHFLNGCHDSVTVYSLDAEFEPLALEELNGARCRVRHVRDFFQNHPHPLESVGVVALGFEIHGDLAPFCALMRRASVAVIEVPLKHQPSLDCLQRVLDAVPCRLRCRVDLDLSSNEPLLQEELARWNMNPPFWARSLRVLEPTRET